jgi:hypothetical protein
VLERDRGCARQLSVSFEGIAEQRTVLERHEFGPVVLAALQQSECTKDAGQACRFELELRIAREERELSRRFAAPTTHRHGRFVNLVGFTQATNAIVGEARARFDRAGTRFVSNHAQRQVMSLPFAEISIVTDVHGRSLSDVFEVLGNAVRLDVLSSITHRGYSVLEIDRGAKLELQLARRDTE